MARPQKEPELLERRIIFRCGKELYDKIHDAAIASGLTLSDVMRWKLSGIKIQDKTHVEILAELGCLRQFYTRHAIRTRQILERVDSISKNSADIKRWIETQSALLKQIERTMDSVEKQFLKETPAGKQEKKTCYL